MSTSPGQHQRDQAILRSVARYRYADIASTSMLQGGNKNVGHVLKKLAAADLLKAHLRGLPGGLTYYQPTKKGSASVGLYGEKERGLNGVGLDAAIAARWWVTREPEHRVRLTHAEVTSLCGGRRPPSSNLIHVATNVESLRTKRSLRALMRVYLPGNNTTASSITKIKKNLEAMETGALAKAFSFGAYGQLVLVEKEEQKLAILKAIQKLSPMYRLAVFVDVAPVASSLARYLKRRKDQ